MKPVFYNKKNQPVFDAKNPEGEAVYRKDNDGTIHMTSTKQEHCIFKSCNCKMSQSDEGWEEVHRNMYD